MAKSRFPVWLIAALLALGTVASYWPATRCDFVNFDDPDFVTANVQVQKGLTWDTLRWGLLNPVIATWHPLTVWSHALDCQLFAANPWGHHLTSVLLHALNTALFFALLQLMTRATWRSLTAAALFALQPLRVESVVWVAERKDVLSGFFGLLALLAYARYAESRTEKAESRKQKAEIGTPKPATPNTLHAPRFTLHICGFYFLSLLLFALGLMSKPMLVTLPCVMLLLDYWPLGRIKKAEVRGQRSEGSDTLHAPRSTPQSQIAHCTPQMLFPLILEKLPFFLLAALGSVATFVVQRQAGAMTGGGELSLGARAANALVSYSRYLGKLLWPKDLAVFYPHPGHWPTGKVVLAGGLIFCLTVLVCAGRRRAPYLLTGWFWFVGMLVPVIGFVQVGDQAMADRYTYLPSLGAVILCVWGAYELARGGRYQAPLFWGAGTVMIILCLALTREQIAYWADGESLFRHALAVTKDNWMAHNNLGGALDEKGQLDEAIREYREVIRLDPSSPDGHNNLGIALGKQGQVDEAIVHFREALRLNPNHADAHNNLGNALMGKGQIDEAITQLREAIRLRPGNAAAHFNLGVALMNKRETDEAISQYQEAIRLDQDYAQAHNNLGIAFAGRGQLDLAIEHFQQALRLRPDYADARKNLDIALAAKARAAQPPGAATNR